MTQIPTLDNENTQTQVEPAPTPLVSPADVASWAAWIKDSYLTPNNINLLASRTGQDHTDKLTSALARMVLSMGLTPETVPGFFTPSLLAKIQRVASQYTYTLDDPGNTKGRVNWTPFNRRDSHVISATINGGSNNDIIVMGHALYANLLQPVAGDRLARYNQTRASNSATYQPRDTPFVDVTLVNPTAVPSDNSSEDGFINALVYNLVRGFDPKTPVPGEVYPRMSVESNIYNGVIPQVIHQQMNEQRDGYIAKIYTNEEVDGKDLNRYTKVFVAIRFYASKSQNAHAGTAINQTFAIDEVIDGQLKPVVLRDISATTAAINNAVASVGAHLGGFAVDTSQLDASVVRTLENSGALVSSEASATDAFTSPTAPVAPAQQVAPQAAPGAMQTQAPTPVGQPAAPVAPATPAPAMGQPAPMASGLTQTQAPAAPGVPAAPVAPVAPTAPAAPVAQAPAPVAQPAPVAPAPAMGQPAPVQVAQGSAVVGSAPIGASASMTGPYNLADQSTIQDLANRLNVENPINAPMITTMVQETTTAQVRQSLLQAMANNGSTISKDVLANLANPS